MCDGECHSLSVIWKRHKGKRYCQMCWNKHPDKNTKPSKKITPIKKISDKTEKLNKLYLVLRETFLRNNLYCKAKLPNCQNFATDVHHMAGRGVYLLDDSLFLPVCRICHGQIEENPLMAKTMGFSVSREEIRTKNEKNKGNSPT